MKRFAWFRRQFRNDAAFRESIVGMAGTMTNAEIADRHGVTASVIRHELRAIGAEKRPFRADVSREVAV